MPLPASLAEVDLFLYRVFRTAGHTPGAENGMRAFSTLGEHAAVWLALGATGAVVDRRRRRRWVRATGTVFGAFVVNTALKYVVGRRRPEVEGLPPLTGTPTGLSFPSAHATTGFTAARAYSALLPGAPLYLLATALACSRLYLGVHYPSDVVAGAVLGGVVGSATR